MVNPSFFMHFAVFFSLPRNTLNPLLRSTKIKVSKINYTEQEEFMMQTFRKLSAFIMVLALMLSMSISVFAANYDAATYEDLETAFADTSGEDVNINVTADIDANYYGLEGKEGITYNIGTENDSTLSNIGFVGGTVVVDTDVEEYLFAYGDADVTVNGDVDGYVDVADEAQVAVEGDVQAVGAFMDATVEIGGNVEESVYTTDNAAVSVEGDATYVTTNGSSTVEIGGDVIDSVAAGDESSVTIAGDVPYVNTNGDSTVEIGGNVTEHIGATDQTTVIIEGNVEQFAYVDGEASVSIGGDVGYIDAYSKSTVEIAGDVTEIAWAMEDATLTIGGNAAEVSADGNATITVEGDSGPVYAYTNANVSVAGDVNGTDGNPDNVDYEDPYSYSDGAAGVYASGDATVTVGGDVTGGDSYGTYGFAGTAISAMDNATITVGGDATGGSVTADPETEAADEFAVSQAGMGIIAMSTATVSVGGDVAGGSTNGNQGYAGVGVQIVMDSIGEAGSITVGGTVTAGTGENEVADMYVMNVTEAEEPAIPEIVVGSCENIEIYGLSEEAAETLKEKIEANFTISAYDPFWNLLMIQIRQAKAGDEITVDAGLRTTIPAAVIDAVREMDVKLIIKWAGGEDIVVDKTFTEEVTGILNLADLAAMIKK